jgi:hypothetical protein
MQTNTTDKNTPVDPEAPDALFADALRQTHKGKPLGRVSTHLRELVEAVKATGKPGKLVLTVTVDPKNSEATLVGLGFAVKLTLPQLPIPAGTFYTDDTGGLCRNDPNQEELNFKPQVMTTAALQAATQPAAAAAGQK